MDPHENFRKVYKSRNLPRSGLLEAVDAANRLNTGLWLILVLARNDVKETQ
jgi:hypothetical protein